MLYVAFISAALLALLFAAEVFAVYGAVALTAKLQLSVSNETGWGGLLGLMVTPAVLFVYWIASTAGIRARKTDAKSFISYGLMAFVLVAVLLFATGSPALLFAASVCFSAPLMLLHYRISKDVFSEYFSETGTQKKSTGNGLNKTWEKKENA